MIKFNNGSTIETIDTGQNVRIENHKSSTQMKWILGDLYKSLKWYQKLYLRVYWNIKS